MRRPSRPLAALCAALLLFAQLAVAAYACPMLATTGGAEAAAPSSPCAEMQMSGAPLDEEQAALCLEHCRTGSHAADQGHTPLALAPATLASVPLELVVLARGTAAPAHWRAQARNRERSPPPSHVLLHCCRRT
jgi:hypothetical protein